MHASGQSGCFAIWGDSLYGYLQGRMIARGQFDPEVIGNGAEHCAGQLGVIQQQAPAAGKRCARRASSCSTASTRARPGTSRTGSPARVSRAPWRG